MNNTASTSIMPSRPAGNGWSGLAAHWAFDKSNVFLNHGSFGGCPVKILERQSEVRALMEEEPVDFMLKHMPALIDESRAKLAAFVGAKPADLVFVENATAGVNAVLRSLTFEPGDELLTTSHEYNACVATLEFVAQRWGAKVVTVELPTPITDPGAITQKLVDAVTDRTKLFMFSHVTSPTAAVLPGVEISQAIEAKGVPVLIDGAHTPGMLPLNIEETGCTWYTGNCHKWICGPKGAGFLWARHDDKVDAQAGLVPAVISHAYNNPPSDKSRYHAMFDWAGTTDFSARICVGDAIDYMASLVPGGWEEIMNHNRELALVAREILMDTLGATPSCPTSMVGCIAAVQIQDSIGEPPAPGTVSDDPKDLYNVLGTRYNIQVPVIPFPEPPARLLRVSGQLYNTQAQYKYLADAVKHVFDSGEAH